MAHCSKVDVREIVLKCTNSENKATSNPIGKFKNDSVESALVPISITIKC